MSEDEYNQVVQDLTAVVEKRGINGVFNVQFINPFSNESVLFDNSSSFIETDNGQVLTDLIIYRAKSLVNQSLKFGDVTVEKVTLKNEAKWMCIAKVIMWYADSIIKLNETKITNKAEMTLFFPVSTFKDVGEFDREINVEARVGKIKITDLKELGLYMRVKTMKTIGDKSLVLDESTYLTEVNESIKIKQIDV